MVDYVAILTLFAFAGIMAAVVVALSVFFGPKNPSRWKQDVYESGSEPLGDAKLRLDVKFYMIAISFIMFVGLGDRELSDYRSGLGGEPVCRTIDLGR